MMGEIERARGCRGIREGKKRKRKIVGGKETRGKME